VSSDHSTPDELPWSIYPSPYLKAFKWRRVYRPTLLFPSFLFGKLPPPLRLVPPQVRRPFNQLEHRFFSPPSGSSLSGNRFRLGAETEARLLLIGNPSPPSPKLSVEFPLRNVVVPNFCSSRRLAWQVSGGNPRQTPIRFLFLPFFFSGPSFPGSERGAPLMIPLERVLVGLDRFALTFLGPSAPSRFSCAQRYTRPA